MTGQDERKEDNYNETMRKTTNKNEMKIELVIVSPNGWKVVDPREIDRSESSSRN